MNNRLHNRFEVDTSKDKHGGYKGLFLNTEFGKLRVWSNEDGIYIDLFSVEDGSVCLVSLHPEEDGMLGCLYGDFSTAHPTEMRFFNRLDKAFSLENIPNIDCGYNLFKL